MDSFTLDFDFFVSPLLTACSQESITRLCSADQTFSVNQQGKVQAKLKISDFDILIKGLYFELFVCSSKQKIYQ